MHFIEYGTDIDPLFKVRPVLDKVGANCLKVEPDEKHAVTEQMIPFKGRYGMKQYIKNKPHKWGIKVFTRADVFGIVYDFEIYTGKGTVTNERGLGIGGEVALRLMREIPKGMNYNCFFDKCFTSPELLAELKQMGILAVAAVGRNCLRCCVLKSDNELAKCGPGSHEVKYETNTGLSVVQWFDSRAVLLCSTYVGVDPVDKCQRWSKQKKSFLKWTDHTLSRSTIATWVGGFIRYAYVFLWCSHSSRMLVPQHSVLPNRPFCD